MLLNISINYCYFNAVMEAFEKQLEADRFQGYDYVGYHAYAKRRYYELVQRKFLASPLAAITLSI